MILWALAGIMALFVIFAFLRDAIYKSFGFRLCSICAAIAAAWIILISLKAAGMEISSLLIGILMGESVAGIMHLFERKAIQAGKSNMLWLKVVVIIIGTLIAYTALSEGFSLRLIILLSISAIPAIGIYRSLKEKKKVSGIHGKFRKEIRKLEKRLEHCCD